MLCCLYITQFDSLKIFIAGEIEAEVLMKSLPLGHGHACLDTAKLPKIFKEIFASALVRDMGASKL